MIKKTLNFNVCINCGFDINKSEDISIDCIYPLDRNKENWNAYCNVSMGGCGRILYAKSLEELEINWNNGITSEHV